MLVETVLGFVAPRLLQGPFCLRTAMDKPAGRGLLLGLAPRGPLARGTEIDQVAHAKLGGTRCVVWPSWPLRLDELRRHGNAGLRQREPHEAAARKLLRGSVTIPAASGKTRLLEKKQYLRPLLVTLKNISEEDS